MRNMMGCIREETEKLVMLVFMCLLFVPSAFADTTYSASDMLLSLQSSLWPLFNLAVGSAYVMGIAFALKGIYDLKMYGESRTMMSGNTNIKGPLFTLFVAAMCIFSPSAFKIAD